MTQIPVTEIGNKYISLTTPDLIKNTGAINIMKNANFVREDNSYINTIGNYIKKEDYINAYEYALKIKDRNI